MTGIYAGAAVAFGVIVLLWLGFRAARKQGAAEQEAEQSKAGIDHAKRANQIDHDVSRLGDADVDRKLFGDK